MTRVKICGIRSSEEARAAMDYGAWAIGLVFAPSRRQVEVEEAVTINHSLPARIVKVGVFVNEKLEVVKNIISRCGLDMVQLHGEEPPEYLKQLPVPAIKSFAVYAPLSAEWVRRWPAWAYLFDTHRPCYRGGTGEVFNWQYLPDFKSPVRIILAGGLNEHNVEAAILRVRPMAVDVSSAIEFPNGGKDPARIQRFINKVKEVDTIVSR